MKLEVGMYVRTKWGIAKVTNLSETIGSRGFYIDREIMDCNEENWKSFCTIHDVIGEPSFNIIDLIEKGDYVNGNLIEMFYDCWNDEIKDYEDILGIAIYDDARMDCITSIRPLTTLDIKSIVTKEQFESMIYKVE